MSLNQLLYIFSSKEKSDVNIINGIRQRLIRYFGTSYDSKTKSEPGSTQRSKGSEESFQLKKTIRSKFSRGNPSRDDNIWSHVTSNNISEAPKHYRTPTTVQIEESTKKSISKYCNVSRRITRCEAAFWCNAALCASKDMGLLGQYVSDGRILKQSVSEAIDSSIKNSMSGYPLYVKKTDKRSINDVKTWLDNLFSKPSLYSMYKNILMFNPLIVLYRFQPKVNEELKEYDIKIREVWCVPHRIIALEHYFFGNIIDSYNLNNQKIPFPITSSGLRNVDISNKIIRRMRSLIDTNRYCNMYSMDYSSYDQSIPVFFIDIFFSIYESNFKLSYVDKKILNLLRFYIKYCPIIHDGRLYFKKSGISSGSLLTNYFDSFVNLTIWYASRQLCYMSEKEFHKCLYNNKYILENSAATYLNFDSSKRENLAVCGDDTLIYTSEYEITVNRILCEYIGMKIEPKHINYNRPYKEVFFLGRYWNSDSEPIQTDLYLFTHLIFKERFYYIDDIDISEELTPMRMISICCPFSNGMDFIRKYFYNFDMFWKFINSRSKFLYLKEWPFDSYVWKDITSIYNWRRF